MLFLLAYACSGFAGLIYQVCWTRLLTLYIGHTTAAASAVVAAFLGGLAAGAASWRRASRPGDAAPGARHLRCARDDSWRWPHSRCHSRRGPSRRSWRGPTTMVPRRRCSRRFACSVCLLMVFVPATALGATFPMAIRWFDGNVGQPRSVERRAVRA